MSELTLTAAVIDPDEASKKNFTEGDSLSFQAKCTVQELNDIRPNCENGFEVNDKNFDEYYKCTLCINGPRQFCLQKKKHEIKQGNVTLEWEFDTTGIPTSTFSAIAKIEPIIPPVESASDDSPQIVAKKRRAIVGEGGQNVTGLEGNNKSHTAGLELASEHLKIKKELSKGKPKK